MSFDTKIKIAISNDLASWQELNVTAFLISGIAGTQNIIGQPYIDKSENTYLPMSQQPIMIHTATREQLQTILQKSISKDVVVTIYTEELFTTYNDEDNRKSISQFTTEQLNIVGIGVRGKKSHVDKLFKGIELHP
ncbi:DUF2000 family protein [Lactococcus lactis]|uniref:DUF2000 family protein n=1 Tax=Lactococcus lactis TaxID=1358 RepID=UPI0020791BD8|nr:DUF2000 family protein [Lactococcus lactis]USI48385.1 DUF2000 family protein [Lactococcus lactis]